MRTTFDFGMVAVGVVVLVAALTIVAGAIYKNMTGKSRFEEAHKEFLAHNPFLSLRDDQYIPGQGGSFPGLRVLSLQNISTSERFLLVSSVSGHVSITQVQP